MFIGVIGDPGNVIKMVVSHHVGSSKRTLDSELQTHPLDESVILSTESHLAHMTFLE